MPINFPASPSVGDIYTYGNYSFRWSGLTWLAQGTVTVAQPNMRGGLPLQQTNMQAFFEAMDDAQNNPVNIVVVGDSTSCTGDAHNERPWPARLSDYLNRTVQLDAPHGYVPAKAGIGPTWDVATGSSSTQDFANHAHSFTGAQYMEHTAVCDRVTIVYRQTTGSGTIQVRDGGAGGTLLGTINANGSSAYTQMWTSDELDLEEHTIHLISGGGGTQIVAGAYFYNGNYDKGVRVWPCCKSGATSATPLATNGYLAEMLAQVDPDLVVFATGFNDYDDYDTRMRTLIDTYEADIPGSKAIWVPYILPSQGTRMDEAKNDQARQIAVDYDMGVIDAGRGIPDMSVNEADLLSDNTHPNANGATLIGQHAFLALSGDPLGGLHYLANTGWKRQLGVTSLVGDVSVDGEILATGAITSGSGTSAATLGNYLGVPIMLLRTTTSIAAPSDGLLTTTARFQAAESQVAADVVRRSQVNQVRVSSLLPSGAIAQNLSRSLHATGNVAPLVSGTLVVVAIDLLAGDLISSISWVTRTTAGSGMTNQWSVLLDSSRVVRAVSADATTAAWAANTTKTFNMVTPYTIPTTGTYHVGLMVAGSVMPTLCGLTSAASTLISITPIVCGTSSTGLTTPPTVGTTMAAIGALGTGTPYAYVS